MTKFDSVCVQVSDMFSKQQWPNRLQMKGMQDIILFHFVEKKSRCDNHLQ